MLSFDPHVNFKHILVVDDDSLSRILVKNQLEMAGIHVTTANDGQYALKLLQDGLNPDVVISDLQMPVMDGFALLQAIRANQNWNTVPFIIISGFDDKTNIQRAAELGADGFLSKPLGRTQLIEILQNCGGRVQGNSSS